MKRIITLILILICCKAFTQPYPNIPPTVKADSGRYEIGYMRPIVLSHFVVGDTVIRPRYNGATRLWFHAAVDTALWVWHTDRWVKIASGSTGGGGATDTLNLSFRIDTLAAKVLGVQLPLDTLRFGNDTTIIICPTCLTPSDILDFVSDVYQQPGTDSVFQVKNGVDEFIFLNSAGGGSGISEVIAGLGLANTNDSTIYLDTASTVVLSRQRATNTYVPLTRNITINGVTQNLSADRIWTDDSAYVASIAIPNGVGDTCLGLIHRNGQVDTVCFLANGVASTGVASYGKNATRDSTVLYLNDGTRFAAKDSIGSGGSVSLNDSRVVFSADGAAKDTSTFLYTRTNGYVGIGSILAPTSTLMVTGGDGLPAMGAETLSGGWTTTGGWTGSGNTYTHTTGTTTLSNSIAAVVGTSYYLAWSISGRTTGTVILTYGGITTIALSATGEFPIVATSTANLVITPTNTFDGTITLSLKVVNGASTPIAVFKNSLGSTLEFRSDTAFNTGIGGGALARNVSGVNTGGSLSSGLNNTALGYNAMNLNVSGSFGTGVGAFALTANKSGLYNTAVGYNTLFSNTTGSTNVAVGSGANGATPLGLNTTGSNNIAIGTATLSKSVAVDGQVAIGASTLLNNVSSVGNTGIGHNVLLSNTGQYNTGVGYTSLQNNITGQLNTAIGGQAGRDNLGSNNIFIGFGTIGGLTATKSTSEKVIIQPAGAGFDNGGNNSIAIGSQSLEKVTGADNTAVGKLSVTVSTATAIARNVGLGNSSVYKTTGNDNVGLGYSAYGVVSNSVDNTGSKNTAVGNYAGSISGSLLVSQTGSNNTAIGYQSYFPSKTEDNQVVIGDSTVGSRLIRRSSLSWGINVESPDASALLDLTSTAKGFLIPRGTTSNINAISTPATGLKMYNSDYKNDMSYNSISWGPVITNHYIAKTGTYTALVTDNIIECTGGGTFTVTLPTAVGFTGKEFTIVNSGAGTITIGTTSSQTFVNFTATPTTLTMVALGSRTVVSNGGNWIIKSSL